MPLYAKLKEKEDALEALFASGQGSDYSEYRHKEEQRAALLDEIHAITEQISSEPDTIARTKELWVQYAAAYNKEFAKQYAAFLDAQKALAAQLAYLLEAQGKAINRHARCKQIIDRDYDNSYWSYYSYTAAGLDLEAPSCLPENLLDEIKTLADTGFLDISKRFGYTKIIRKQPTSEAEMCMKYEDLPLQLQAGLFRAFCK